jgi:hypothetical protein
MSFHRVDPIQVQDRMHLHDLFTQLLRAMIDARANSVSPGGDSGNGGNGGGSLGDVAALVAYMQRGGIPLTGDIYKNLYVFHTHGGLLNLIHLLSMIFLTLTSRATTTSAVCLCLKTCD